MSPKDVEREQLVNLRLELQEVTELMRHGDIQTFGVAAFVIPITTAGLALGIDGSRCLALLVGISSILIWIFFYGATWMISARMSETREYLAKLYLELEKRVGLNEKQEMNLAKILKPYRFTYFQLLLIMGGFIIIVWIFYIFENRLLLQCLCCPDLYK